MLIVLGLFFVKTLVELVMQAKVKGEERTVLIRPSTRIKERAIARPFPSFPYCLLPASPRQA